VFLGVRNIIFVPNRPTKGKEEALYLL
jgi:hypothetical protein